MKKCLVLLASLAVLGLGLRQSNRGKAPGMKSAVRLASNEGEAAPVGEALDATRRPPPTIRCVASSASHLEIGRVQLLRLARAKPPRAKPPPLTNPPTIAIVRRVNKLPSQSLSLRPQGLHLRLLPA